MDGLQVSLFGRLSVKWAGEVAVGFEAKKVQELFAYLLVYRTRTHSREVLAELLWGDRQSTQSRKYLRQTLWQLQSVLEKTSTCESTQWLDVDTEWVQLNPSAGLWLDVAELERAYVLAQGMAGGDLTDECVHALEQAVHVYRGDFLEGCYQDWCIFERERLQNIYLSMLDKLVAYCEVRGDYEAGLVYGAQVLRVDRARERTHRQMMRLYCLARNRTDALRQYERCVEALTEELGVQPSRRTKELVERIRADHLDGFAPAPISADGGSSDRALPEVLVRLKQLQTLLYGIQREIQEKIDAVETAVNLRR